MTISLLSDLGARARHRVARRLLPFVFLIYVVNYLDRVNVSFANLRMSADLGFSDRVYGLGVGIFYLTYVLFEIPGAIIVERWSARKWIARIMISWGVVTILTGFVQNTAQFYAARFFLGLAEASFFPGMVVYLTHWFCSRDRGRAMACLYIAVPTASFIGSPIAGWLLGVHWWQLAGWRSPGHSMPGLSGQSLIQTPKQWPMARTDLSDTGGRAGWRPVCRDGGKGDNHRISLKAHRAIRLGHDR